MAARRSTSGPGHGRSSPCRTASNRRTWRRTPTPASPRTARSARPRRSQADESVAVFGAVVNATLGPSGTDGDRVPPDALTTAVHAVFLGVTALAVAMLAAVLLMPRDRGRLRTPAQETSGVAAG